MMAFTCQPSTDREQALIVYTVPGTPPELRSDKFVDVPPALERVGNFAAFLDQEFDDAPTYAALREVEAIGRPVGTPEWLSDIEQRTGLTLAPQKRGPKPQSEASFSGFSKVSA